MKVTGDRHRSSTGLGTTSYEPYDMCLCRLASSLVVALTSVNGRGASKPNLGVSRVASYPAASRAQTRAQIGFLRCGVKRLAASTVQLSSKKSSSTRLIT